MFKQLQHDGSLDDPIKIETICSRLKSLLFDHYFTGTLVYILGSAGYVILNMREGWFEVPPHTDDILNVALAALFVFDAFLCVLLWRQDQSPSKWGHAFWAEILNMLPSLGYLAAAILQFYENYVPEDEVDYNVSARWFELASMLLFVVDSLLYFAAWYVLLKNPYKDPRGCRPGELYVWANVMNAAGSFIYLVGTIVGIMDVYHVIIGSGSRRYNEEETQVKVSKILVWGDFIYLIDSMLFMACWRKDAKEASFPSELSMQDMAFQHLPGEVRKSRQISVPAVPRRTNSRGSRNGSKENTPAAAAPAFVDYNHDDDGATIENFGPGGSRTLSGGSRGSRGGSGSGSGLGGRTVSGGSSGLGHSASGGAVGAIGLGGRGTSRSGSLEALLPTDY